MYTSYNLLSHKNLKNKGDQLIEEHLKGVSNIMVNLAKNKGICDEEFIEVIRIIGYCHDFGKGSCYFQDYLQEKYNGDLKNHGEISAYLCYYLLPEKWKLYGFIAVKKHHGNIVLESSFFDVSSKANLLEIIKSLEKNIEVLNKIYNMDISDFFERIKDGSLIKEVKKLGRLRAKRFKNKSEYEVVEEFVCFQYIWSLLLTADKTQLIRGNEYINKDNLKEDLCKSYKEGLRNSLIKNKKGIENSRLFKVRDEIYNEVIQSIEDCNLDQEKIFSVNVPTGTGKTISVYGGALKLKEKIQREKGFSPDIIYSLPFTSVIDQNYNVLEEIFNYNNITISSELIMKYHSLCEIEYRDDESKEYLDYDGKFLMENWQSTIINTTFIQIFNSIFKSGVNNIIHRFHRLVGSIIILDEVQSINPKYYKIIEYVFKILCDKFNCYIITVTATKPLFLLGKELVKSNEKIFKEMDRIVFCNYMDKETSIEDFKNIIIDDINKQEDKSFLFIMNTIKISKEIKDFLGESIGGRKVYYLSTELLPIHRLKIIRKIRESKEKTILVSTQLVEAGVDIDFDVVYRDIAPLDSINQSAGRGNRNGIGTKGIVNLYRLINDDGKEVRGQIYSNFLIEITQDLFEGKKFIGESEIFDLNNEYFKRVVRATKKINEQVFNEFIDNMKNMNFKDIRDNFELIAKQDYKVDVIVRYDEEVNKNIKIIKESSEYLEVVNAWRRLNAYKISINKYVLNNNYEEELGVNFLDRSNYDKNIGYVENKTNFS